MSVAGGTFQHDRTYMVNVLSHISSCQTQVRSELAAAQIKHGLATQMVTCPSCKSFTDLALPSPIADEQC